MVMTVPRRELMPAVTVLQLFLSSSKPVLRFAAVRTLNRVAQTHPMSVTNCNIDMESLISDQNRSIATLAITTLLKTGTRRRLCQAAPLPVDISCVSASHGAKALELIELKRIELMRTLPAAAQATRAAWTGC
jgi:Adaptin N terminal region